nr:unnamed protein product [Callosobruchus chinensis]
MRPVLRAEWHRGLSGVLNGACWEQGGTQQYLPLILLNGSLGGWTAATRYPWDLYGKTKNWSGVLSPAAMEEDELLRSGEEDNTSKPPESQSPVMEPMVKSSRSELRRRRKEEALARGEKILSRSERRRPWEAKHGARKNPPTSEASSSGTQGAGVVSTQSASSKAQPSTSRQSNQKGKRLHSQRTPEEAARATKRSRTEVGTMRPPESFADKEAALKIKMELGRRAIRGKDVHITSCHPENGAVVVGCANTHTKSWLETQFKQLDPFEGIQLRLDPARSLVRMCKVTTFVPRTTGAETKDDVMLGQKSQSGLDTDHWAVVGGNTTPEGQLLVIHVDEASLQKLRSLGMRPFLGAE